MTKVWVYDKYGRKVGERGADHAGAIEKRATGSLAAASAAAKAGEKYEYESPLRIKPKKTKM